MDSGNKIYERLLYIKTHNLLDFTIRFLSENIFHILMECLITIYLMVLVGIFTNFMILDLEKIPLITIFVLFPTIAVVLLSILFGIFCIRIVINKIYEYSRQIISDRSDRTQVFHKITKQYECDVMTMHRIGIYLYTIASALGVWLLTYLYPNNFISPNGFIIFIFCIGFIMGIIWNVSGIYRNQRLNWCYLLDRFKTEEIAKINRKRNYILYLKSAVCSILALLMILTIIVIIIVNLNMKIQLNDIISDYSFIVLAFLALLSMYIKISVQKLFFDDNAIDVFPGLKVILNMH